MTTPPLTQADVLAAVSASRTPLGAIIDRLATKWKVRRTDIDQDAVVAIVTTLTSKELVLVSTWQGETLYKKVPHALQRLNADTAEAS